MEGLGFGLAMGSLFFAIAWYNVRKLEHGADPVDRLRTLAQLHEDGLLDDAEHRKLRKRQLSRLRWSD